MEISTANLFVYFLGGAVGHKTLGQLKKIILSVWPESVHIFDIQMDGFFNVR